MHSVANCFLTEHVSSFTRSLREFQHRIPADAQPTSDALTHELTAAINISLAECARLERQLAGQPLQLKNIQAAYREAIWPWFGQSWFMRRALDKPRGYPGDFEMLTGIYNGQTKSLGLGGYLDRYFLKTTLARAVRGRMQAVRQFLLEELEQRAGDVTILNVACGPCRELVEHFVPQHEGRIRLVCVDNDPLALNYVQSCVAPLVADFIDCEFVQYNALRMTSSRRNIAEFGRPDIIYSVGLCDYISDRVLVPMLQGWRESLSVTGIVYVAFKDSARYQTPEYQWLVDWFFLQRTEPECRRLCAAAGYDMEQLAMNRDTTGVILNYVGRSPVREFVRVDSAEQLPHSPRMTATTESQEEPTSI